MPSPPPIPAPGPHEARLTVELRHKIGALEIDANFKLTRPWTILFGPSGSGKTTILRAIAGLLQPDFAVIVSHPETASSKNAISLTDTGKGIFLPPHKRHTPLAAQSPALFPHMTVLQNIRYGDPETGGPSEADSRSELLSAIPKLFRIQYLLDQRPCELSGGEAQRVSLARAVMARKKHLLLLDEPFAGLDGAMRDALIADLLAWQEREKLFILSVTHDIGEAFLLGAEVIKIATGRVIAQGPPAEVLAEERARLLAQLAAES